MITLKNYFFIIALITCVSPMYAMQQLIDKVSPVTRFFMGIQTDEEIENAFNKKVAGIDAIYERETNSDAYDQIRKQYRKDSLLLHPDKSTGKTDEEITQLLASRGVKQEDYANKGRDGLLDLVKQEFQKSKKSFDKPVDKRNCNRKTAENDSEHARRKREEYAFLIYPFTVGGLTIGTVATIVGLIKAWHLLKEYSSPNTILLEKMDVAADKAVSLILNLEFDRYNPTKDTDALYMQFDIDPLLAQLSSDEVRNQVKKAILAFDKTLEYTYEQCAWHYDNLTPEELVKQNPRLVREMKTKLQAVKEAFMVCRADPQLDRNWFFDFFKRSTKK